MTYIYVPFDSIESLIEQFQNINISLVTCSKETANFVIITPKLYYGIYGGLVYNSVFETCSKSQYISDAIDNEISLLWWYCSRPKFIGDTYVLSVVERVAVTPSIYKELILNPLHKRTNKKSSYYGAKTWSWSFSDSE